MGRCRRHPHHIVVGICAFCLSEQLSSLLVREDDDGTDLYAHLHTHPNLHSPFAFTSSNPSTACGTVPETPFTAPRKTPPRFPHDRAVAAQDVSSPKASSHQCFSLSFSPHNRLRSVDSYTPSVCSPQNQVFLGNHDFIKGEIPRKKNSFWAFLHRRKPGFYNACGTASLHRNYVLNHQEATQDEIYDHYHMHLQQLKTKVQKNVHVSLRDKHIDGEKRASDRHNLSKIVSPSMYCESFDRDNAALRRISMPPCSARPNHYQKNPSLSKQRYSIGPKTIGLSPLRHERHGDENVLFSQGLRIPYHVPLCGIEKYGDAKRSHPGSSSSWSSSLILPQKMRRSKSISGLSESSDFGPTIQATSQSSPDVTATTVSFANEAMNGSPQCMLVKVSEDNAIRKGVCNMSANQYRQTTQIKSRSLISSSPYGLHHSNEEIPISGSYNTNHSQYLDEYAHGADRKSPHLSKPSLSQRLSSRSAPNSVNIACCKSTTRASPLMLASQKKGSSPHGLLIHGKPHAVHNIYDDDGDVKGAMHGYMPPYQGLDERSTVPSDDEYRRSPNLFDLNLPKSMHSKSPRQSKRESHSCKNHQIQEPAFGSHVFAYSTRRSWGKALGNILRIRRGKKQSIEVQSESPNTHNHYVQQYDMGKMQNLRVCKHHQSHHNEDDNDADDCDFIDYEQSDLYDDYYSQRDIPLEHIKARHELLQAQLEPHVFPGLQDQIIKGLPPQQYNFLSRDYSAFSCYFSPPMHGFQKAEVDMRGHVSSHKQMQKRNGDVGISRKSTLLLSTTAAAAGGMRGI
ncbi:hypothetical protein GOP47_0015117 [Adiantum capillus-veneris]|uniref:Uncharacterized protein n=1 Tax=Adiantum capillus-veneris TaxID=13818 RepID=A0A9D4UMS3_ADICA|nr:hypothetical protein GOP47_0015117 [Adiantum capillus-veneris]